jgi:hypothetical protein
MNRRRARRYARMISSVGRNRMTLRWPLSSARLFGVRGHVLLGDDVCRGKLRGKVGVQLPNVAVVAEQIANALGPWMVVDADLPRR